LTKNYIEFNEIFYNLSNTITAVRGKVIFEKFFWGKNEANQTNFSFSVF